MAQYDLKLFGEELILDNVLDAAIQELDILFGTEETQLLGDSSYGVNFEQFLWKLHPSIPEVNYYIRNKINDHTMFCKQLDIEIETEVAIGTLRDIYVVHISLKNKDGEKEILKNWIFK